MDMFVQTAKKTGPNLTTDSFVKTLDTTVPRDMFGSPGVQVHAQAAPGQRL
jgi:branched-chain amino acid transport system substrate-binding protein